MPYAWDLNFNGVGLTRRTARRGNDQDGPVPLAMPVHVINGRRDGPQLFVSAAVHGDALFNIGLTTGTQIVARTLDDFDPLEEYESGATGELAKTEPQIV